MRAQCSACAYSLLTMLCKISLCTFPRHAHGTPDIYPVSCCTLGAAQFPSGLLSLLHHVARPAWRYSCVHWYKPPAEWGVQGYAWAEDKEHCEEYGRMLQADPSKVSQRAKKRGLPQVAPPPPFPPPQTHLKFVIPICPQSWFCLPCVQLHILMTECLFRWCVLTAWRDKGVEHVQRTLKQCFTAGT